MGGDHEYGRGDASGGGSRSYGGGGRRGYGGGSGQDGAAGTPGGGADPGYGAGREREPRQAERGGGSRGYGDAGQDDSGRGDAGYGGGERGYGASGSAGSGSGAGNGSGGARGYGQEDAAGGGGRGYGGGGSGGGARGYGEAPADPFGSSRSSRGRQGPIPGEVVYGDSGSDGGASDGTRAMPSFPDEPTRAGEEAVGTAPRRTRSEERQAARNGSAGGPPETEYAPGQERSSRYGPSAIDGRSTRNGAGRRAGERAAARPAKKTGYHKYFDYPRTGKAGWRHWMPSIKQVSSCMLGGFFLLIGLIAFEYATVQIPTAESIASTAQVNTFTYDDGTSTIATEGSTNRTNVDISQIPAMMQNAIIAAEDKTFKTNPGISYTGMIRSFINDVEGKPLQGGSTITQEYVKNAYLTQSQTFSRKIDEVFIALKIGKTWTKNQVMQNYLNTIFYGRNAYGIQAGAKVWLGKDINQITDPADAAFMASLVQQPTNFSKGWSADEDQATQLYWQTQLKTRWAAVLKNMEAYGTISQADYTAAIAKFPVPATAASNSETVDQQQMTQAVKNWIESYQSAHPNDKTMPTLDQIESGHGGYTIVTTFNKKYMALAKQAVTDQLLSKVKGSSSWYNQNLQPAMAAVDPTTGDLIAFYGGTTEFNWAIQGQVQPGSTFKAFTLATAFEQNWSPDSYISGISPWPAPGNATEKAAAAGDRQVTNDGNSPANVTLTTATAQSINTAFVRLSNAVTYKDVMATVNKLGITDKNAQGLSADARLTLGISAVSPARMAAAYSAFANNGSQYPLMEVKEIKNSDGSDWKPNAQPTQVLDPNVAETVTQTLTHVTHDQGATAYGATDQSGLSNIAGKTGTSTMALDTLRTTYPDIYSKTQNGYFTTAAAWFNGYTPKLEAAVAVSRWINEKDPKTGKMVAVQAPVDNINGAGFTFGGSVSLPIWSEFMKLMQGTGSKFAGDPGFATPNTSGMTIMNSPSASTSASASAPANPGNPGTNTASASASPSPSPSSSATCSIFNLGNCTGGGSTPTTGTSATTSPSATTSKRSGGNG